MEVLSKLKTAKRKGPDGSFTSKDDIISTMDNFPVTMQPDNKENEDSSHGPQSLIGEENNKWEYVDFSKGDETAPASLSHSYSLEWEKLFGRAGMMQRLKEKAQVGDLRSSRFRSVIWKLFLEVLPANIDQWILKTRESRAKFDELKDRLIVNPRKAVDSINLSLHNPLSQDVESPWNKFFQDNELRLTIKQDVIRTFPEVEFFRSEGMMDLMNEILFCFSREHATHSYKQGMHELLAPLIFVLHCDHQAFLHACEIESVLDIMKEVMDPAYLEHDAYSMFCQVMETVEPWYLSRDFSRRNGSMRSLDIINATPFARSQDLNPSNVIVTKLTRIQDYVLKRLDPELHLHLERLEIAPQIYGIRWLRLLFGREFPMQDLLMLWDAIFGDGIGFDLVDYVFVAMLMYLRDVLIASDYTTCLSILMKYPPVPDVHYFVDKALYIREPSQHPRPPNYSHQGSVSTMSSSDSLSIYDNLPSQSSSITSASRKLATKVNQRGWSVKQFTDRHQFKATTGRLDASHQGHKRQSPMLGGFSSFSRKFSRPRTLSVQPSQKNMPKSSSEPMNLQTDMSPESASQALGSTVSLEDAMFRHTPSASSLARLEASDMRSAQSSPGGHHSNIFPLTPEDAPSESPTKYNTLPSKHKVKPKKLTKSERALHDQVAQLQGQLNEKNNMCIYCATKLDVHIERLQTDLFKQNLDAGDSVMVSLAGLKLVRDVLNGTLKFSQTICDESEEISINYGYYANDEVSSDADRGSSVMSPESDILLGATSDTFQAKNSFYVSSEDVSPDGPEPSVNVTDAKDNSYAPTGASSTNSSGQLLKSSSEERNTRKSHHREAGDSIPKNAFRKERNNSMESNDGSAPITSRIRSMFKSSASAQKTPINTVPYSSGDKVVSEGKSNASTKQMTPDEYHFSSGREPHHKTDGFRLRSKSGDEKHPLFDQEYGGPGNLSQQSRPSRGSHSNVISNGKKAEGQEDPMQRERSKSQPLNSLGRSSAGNNNNDINPLYQWKYDQGIDY